MIELNGRPASAADLSALGLCNYAHYTTMSVENAAVRGLDLHLERLARDCEIVHGAELDLDKVRALVRRAPLASPVVVRVTIFNPALDLRRPSIPAEPGVLITTRPAVTGILPPLRLQTAQYERELPHVKHGAVFGAVHRRRNAQMGGFDDVLFADRHARISEGATWNIAFLREERVVWPASTCLEGVTMRLVKDVMRREGIDFEVAAVDAREISSLPSAFVTNAVVGVRAVGSVNGFPLRGDAAIIGLLREAYTAFPGEPL